MSDDAYLRSRRDPRRRRVGQLAALVATGALLLGTVPPAVYAKPSADRPLGIPEQAFGAEPDGPVLATGSLVNKLGNPTPGRVAIFAWPTIDEMAALPGDAKVEPVLVGWGTTDANGRFSIHSDESLIPGDYRTVDGALNLQVEAWNDDVRGTWMKTSGGPTDEAYGTSEAAAASGAIAVQQDKADTSGDITIPLERKVVAASPQTATPVDGGLTSLAAPLPSIPPDCWWVKSSLASVKHKSNIVSTWPRLAKWGVRVSASHTVTVETGLSAGVSFANFSGTGSWATTVGISYKTAASPSAYDFWSFENYHRYQEQCYGPYGGSIVNIRWAYLPEGPTADADYTSVTLFPSSRLYCARVNLPSGTEWARSQLSTNTASLGGAIKTSGVLGINLDLTSKLSSSSTTGYDVFAILGSTAMYVCGDTSDHLKWNQVWEPRSYP